MSYGVYSGPRADDNINWMGPVNWQHPITHGSKKTPADGLAGMWAALPHQPGWGSNTWLDLTDPVHGNHGTLTNMTPSSAWAERAVQFDGVDDYVLVANNSSVFRNSVSGTWAARFRSDSTPPSGPEYHHPIISRSDASGSFNGATWRRRQDGTIGFQAKSGGAITLNLGGTYVTQNHEWVDVVVCWDCNTGSTTRGYVNGVEDFSGTASAGWTFGNNDFRFGDALGSFWGELDGAIEYVAVWNRTLSVEEIEDLHVDPYHFLNRVPTYRFSAPAAPTPANAVTWWSPGRGKAPGDSINWIQPINWQHHLAEDLRGFFMPLQYQPGWDARSVRSLTDPVNSPVGSWVGNISNTVMFDRVNTRSRDVHLLNAAYQFDGGGAEYIEWPSYERDYTFTTGSQDQPFTVSAWLRYVYGGGGNAQAPICSKYDDTPGGGGFSGQWTWNIQDSDDKIYFQTLDDSTSVRCRQTSNTALPTNTWIHVAATYDASAVDEGVILYRNGVVDPSTGLGQDGSYVSMSADDSQFRIGTSLTDNGTFDGYFGGTIACILIHGRVLPPGEIEELYHESRWNFPALLNRMESWNYGIYTPVVAGTGVGRLVNGGLVNAGLVNRSLIG